MSISNGKDPFAARFSRRARVVMTASAMAISATTLAGLVVACGSDETPASPADEDAGSGFDGAFLPDSSDPPEQLNDAGVFTTPNADAGCPLKYAGPRNGGVTKSVPRAGTTGGIVWEATEKALTVDGQYARAVLGDDQQSEYLRVTSYGFNLPATVSVKGVVVQLKRRGDNKILDGNIQLWLDGVASDRPKFIATTPWPVAIGTHHYGQEVDTWGNDLTPAIINGAGFGTEVYARRRPDAGTGPINAEIESLLITIWYCE